MNLGFSIGWTDRLNFKCLEFLSSLHARTRKQYRSTRSNLFYLWSSSRYDSLPDIEFRFLQNFSNHSRIHRPFPFLIPPKRVVRDRIVVPQFLLRPRTLNIRTTLNIRNTFYFRNKYTSVLPFQCDSSSGTFAFHVTEIINILAFELNTGCPKNIAYDATASDLQFRFRGTVVCA